jgi:glycosyltransferase involved in cell wall biosynthesis
VPIISVLIPNFNRNKLLYKTIQSISNQTINLSLLEVVVVDDCSDKEDPTDVISQFNFPIKLIRNSVNLGQVKNLNTCITSANCDYIHILHSDDLLHCDFYKRVLNVIYQTQPACIFSSSFYIDDFDKVIGKNKILSLHDGILYDLLDRLYVEQVIQTPSIVIKKAVYQDVGFFRQDLFMTEDWDMWVRIARNFNFWYIADYLSYYRVNSNSTSSNNTFNGNFLKDLVKLQNHFYLQHDNFKLLKKSQIKYAQFFVSYSKKVKGFLNNLRHLIYIKPIRLKLIFIINKLKS